MFAARNKTDLMIEVWEWLDCESVGKNEIIAIEKAVEERFGSSAVDSPMVIARLLADEGAELRHSEIMELFVERASDRPYDAAMNGLFEYFDLSSLRTSLLSAENLRKELLRRGDNSGLRELRRRAIDAKKRAQEESFDKSHTGHDRDLLAEAARWLVLWLQSPELFENWVELRVGSREFRTLVIHEEDR